MPRRAGDIRAGQCGAVFPETGQRCTKRPGHYHPVRSLHGNDKPGREVQWAEAPSEKEDAA